jgi:putative FmdB family regulatory protein
MPVYEYECEGCGAVKEHIFPINHRPDEVQCPYCSDVSHRIMSKNSFFLSGSCWCKDGYTTSRDKGRKAGTNV